MRILLVEPRKSKKYYTPYPPLGLLKLAAFHRGNGHTVRYIQGYFEDDFTPDEIMITSLFTYAYEPVHDAINYYSNRYKKSRIVVGGIYATLCSDHLQGIFGNRIEIHKGLLPEIESILPDYSLVPEWKISILFSSRGCIRDCPYCSVAQLEPQFKAEKTIKHLIYPGHKKAIFWDNNILASPYWKDIFDELRELDLEVDFNQGLDARLMTEEVAKELKNLRMRTIRLAYDSAAIRPVLKQAIAHLNEAGIRGREIVVYCLYNYFDSPDDFFKRLRDIADWGVVAYPMRYEPLQPLPKNTYVSPHWTAGQLEMVAKARRVIGFGGAFPPYEGLKKKFLNADNLNQALCLRAPIGKKDTCS